ncbi:hypothetical protein [Streptomyces sp. NPDC002611]
MATITTGSSSEDDSRAPGVRGWSSGALSKSATRRWRATSAGVGWSKTSVDGRSSPVSPPSRSTSSTVPTDVMPSSVKGAAASGGSPGV